MDCSKNSLCHTTCEKKLTRHGTFVDLVPSPVHKNFRSTRKSEHFAKWIVAAVSKVVRKNIVVGW